MSMFSNVEHPCTIYARATKHASWAEAVESLKTGKVQVLCGPPPRAGKSNFALNLFLDQVRKEGLTCFTTGDGRLVVSLHPVPRGEETNPTTDRTQWVCGKMRGKDAQGNAAWDLQGVFDTEELAVAACQDSQDFVGPVPLNQKLPHAPTEWPGCRYPNQPKEPDMSTAQNNQDPAIKNAMAACFRCVTPKKCAIHGCCPNTWPSEAKEEATLQKRLDDYATEINRLRNVIQSACIGGTGAMLERWKELFPDAPVPTVQPQPFGTLHLAPDYMAVVKVLAKTQSMTEAQVLRAALRLYQAECTGRVKVESTELGMVTHAEDWYRLKAFELVDEMTQAGFVLTVLQTPLKPLAMGNYATIVNVRPVRK